jgi:hypothetical protein
MFAEVTLHARSILQTTNAVAHGSGRLWRLRDSLTSCP